MDENRFEGAARKVGGKVEGAVGDITGDTKTQAEGLVDNAAGTAQNAYCQAKDAVRNATGDYGSQVLDQIEEAGDMIAEQVDQRPITALLIAAGIGFLLALATKPAPQVVYRRR
ncbi:MAG: CsbD family protein [Acetobacteraceae bacterium]